MSAVVSHSQSASSWMPSGREVGFLAAGAAAGIAAYRLWCARGCVSVVGDRSWFSEVSEFWPGQAFSLKIKRMLHQTKSKFQSIGVFDSESFGRVLTIDGAIQLTTKDEHVYHEALAHTCMSINPSAVKALVLGGGDGGIVREFLKYKQVASVDLCELDDQVIEVSKKYVPETALSMFDPRVTTYVQDGFVFLGDAARRNTYDAVVADLSDPVGPANTIFNKDFLQLLFNCLTENAVVVMQGESYWLHMDLITSMMQWAKQVGFRTVSYGTVPIPSYPCGQIGMLVLAKGDASKVDVTKVSKAAKIPDGLQYYSPAMHSAQFVLPVWVQKRLATALL